MKIKRFEDIIKEDAATTASPGSGTAVSGGATGSFTTANGVAVSGGSTGTSFSTNSSMSGMGAVVSPQPSDTPGDVAGSTKGSGDIGANLGTYTKKAPKTKKKKKEKKVSDGINAVENTIIRSFSDMYTESNKTIDYNYVGVKDNDVVQIYIVPFNQTDAFNIGYIDDDSQFVLYDEAKFRKESMNELKALEVTNKQKVNIEETITDTDKQKIENYIKL